jgi:polyisoprenoid-binding protein YceI
LDQRKSARSASSAFYCDLHKDSLMQPRTLLPLALMLFALLLGGCSTAGAPAAAPAAEAPAAESAATEVEAAPAPAAAVGDAVEAPPVNPVDTAPEATAQPTLGRATFVVAPEQSRAEYAVEEEFLGAPVPFVTTVGSTDAIEGEIALTIADGAVEIGDNRFVVDLRTLQSDEARRDNRLRTEWLESDRYPQAEFVATEIVGMPADAALGEEVSFQVQGDLTIRDITQPVTWDVSAAIDGDTLSGVATTLVYMRNYGFEPPDIAGMLRVTDGVTVTVVFVAKIQ